MSGGTGTATATSHRQANFIIWLLFIDGTFRFSGFCRLERKFGSNIKNWSRETLTKKSLKWFFWIATWTRVEIFRVNGNWKANKVRRFSWMACFTTDQKYFFLFAWIYNRLEFMQVGWLTSVQFLQDTWKFSQIVWLSPHPVSMSCQARSSSIDMMTEAFKIPRLNKSVPAINHFGHGQRVINRKVIIVKSNDEVTLAILKY